LVQLNTTCASFKLHIYYTFSPLLIPSSSSTQQSLTAFPAPSFKSKFHSF